MVKVADQALEADKRLGRICATLPELEQALC